MWGIMPAAGAGSRIQPLAFSKELLPVGSRFDGQTEKPRAVSEYLVERMILGGVNKICVVISPGKSDIMEYYSGGDSTVRFCYVVQPKAQGLCDAIFSAIGVVGKYEPVVIGLPDTVWFPEDALKHLEDEKLSFLLFPVARPEFFDAVVMDEAGRILRIEVKQKNASSNWIWGAFKMGGEIFYELYDLWLKRERQDEYFGTLVNAYIEKGAVCRGVKVGKSYVDVGTIDGYRQAINILSSKSRMKEGVCQ